MLAETLALLAADRLVTLTGAGGIGKTRLARGAAWRVRRQFPDGVWIAEFSSITDPAQALADRRRLVILDTCEHVIDAAASMAEALLRAGSGVRIIATSRERLRAEDERIYRVPPLAVFGTDEDRDPRRRMKLYAALASLSYWHSASIFAQVCILWAKALAIVERLDDPE